MKGKLLGGEAAPSVAGGHAGMKTGKEKKKEGNRRFFPTVNKQFVPPRFTLQRQTCRGTRPGRGPPGRSTAPPASPPQAALPRPARRASPAAAGERPERSPRPSGLNFHRISSRPDLGKQQVLGWPFPWAEPLSPSRRLCSVGTVCHLQDTARAAALRAPAPPPAAPPATSASDH